MSGLDRPAKHCRSRTKGGSVDETEGSISGGNTDDGAPMDESEGWAAYHAATQGRPPHPLLVRAAAMLPAPGDALDLGCGAGNDTRYLLALGFRVTAVDADPDAVGVLKALDEKRLRAIRSTFADFVFDRDGYDLISAQLALPFNPPESFDAMFSRLMGALRPGGIFTGHLFGVRDAWNTSASGMSFHTRVEAERLLDGLQLREFSEGEGDVQLVSGEQHHGHSFEIIAQRPAASRVRV
jgi:tellurite methyltransferase